MDKIEIKLFKKFEYDPKAVREYCQVYAPALMVVDYKSFEKVAESFPEAPVTISRVPKATIGTDLSQYLEEKKEGGE